MTITGGKLTSFRLMADETVDAAAAQLAGLLSLTMAVAGRRTAR